jgi:hypothetical protein
MGNYCELWKKYYEVLLTYCILCALIESFEIGAGGDRKLKLTMKIIADFSIAASLRWQSVNLCVILKNLFSVTTSTHNIIIYINYGNISTRKIVINWIWIKIAAVN